MARIRSIKPEHTLNHKVGYLSDRAYRIWISLICNADDEGRGVLHADEIRARTYGFQPRVSTVHITEAIKEIQQSRLVYCYSLNGKLYYQLHEWEEHQRISHPSTSRFPPCPEHILQNLPESSGEYQSLPEISGGLRTDQGSRIKDQGIDQGIIHVPLAPPFSPSQKPWPSVESLVDLYNTSKPSECSEVREITAARRKKYAFYLKQFPSLDFWIHVFDEMGQSPFLRGLGPSSLNYPAKARDLDWLCQKGKDDVENCQKTFEGKYQDKKASQERNGFFPALYEDDPTNPLSQEWEDVTLDRMRTEAYAVASPPLGERER